MTSRNLLLSFVAAGLLFTQGGCLLVAAAAGTGATVAYVRGDLETSLQASPDQVAAAAKASFEELKLPVISTESSQLDAKVLARTAQDVKVTVTAKSESEKLSKVTVRVGTFGDAAMQNQILEKIKQHLAGEPVAGAED